MSKLRKEEFGFVIRIWSKNFDEEMAYSDVFHLSYSVFNDSNWLQGRIQSVVKSDEEFVNWIVFVSETIDDFYRFSNVDRWYYYGPSNFNLNSENIFVEIDGKEYEVANNNSNLNKITELLKGKGDMRDSGELYDAGDVHDYQVLPIAYFFLHQGSIMNGDDFVELNYPKGVDIENWEECERGWELVCKS
jgi:hypothetical protein